MYAICELKKKKILRKKCMFIQISSLFFSQVILSSAFTVSFIVSIPLFPLFLFYSFSYYYWFFPCISGDLIEAELTSFLLIKYEKKKIVVTLFIVCYVMVFFFVCVEDAKLLSRLVSEIFENRFSSISLTRSFLSVSFSAVLCQCYSCKINGWKLN